MKKCLVGFLVLGSIVSSAKSKNNITFAPQNSNIVLMASGSECTGEKSSRNTVLEIVRIRLSDLTDGRFEKSFTYKDGHVLTFLFRYYSSNSVLFQVRHELNGVEIATVRLNKDFVFGRVDAASGPSFDCKGSVGKKSFKIAVSIKGMRDIR